MSQIDNRTLTEVIQNGQLDQDVDEDMPPLEEYYSSDDEDLNTGYHDKEDKEDEDDFFNSFPPQHQTLDEDVSSILDNSLETSNQTTDYTEILNNLDVESEVQYYEDTQNRRTRRQRVNTNRYKPQELHLIMAVENRMTEETISDSIAQAIEEDITPFLPEPKNERDLRKVDDNIKRRMGSSNQKGSNKFN